MEVVVKTISILAALFVVASWSLPSCAPTQSATDGEETESPESPEAPEVEERDTAQEESGADAGDELELVESFVRDFNAGEIEALADEYADRLDWRLFDWSEQLGELETVPADETESFVEGYIADIDEKEQRAAFEQGWEEARAGAAEHDLRWVIVEAEGLAEEALVGVPALAFGVVDTDEGQAFAVGTAFDELIEELVMIETSMSRIAEEGVGADPERFQDLE